jgi:hypothetical protein
MKLLITRNTKPDPIKLLLLKVDDKEAVEASLFYSKEPFDNTIQPEDASIDAIECNYCFNVMTMAERISFLNWAYTKLKVGGKLVLKMPNWAHSKAYMDPAIQWPPVCGEFFYLTKKDTREAMLPCAPLTSDFSFIIQGTFDQTDAWVSARNLETQQTLMHRNINTTVDVQVTLSKDK